jgi:hypothetical protein
MADVKTDLTQNIGRVTVQAGIRNFGMYGAVDEPESMTATEAEELIGKLRAAVNTVRSHNRARLTKPFWK